MRTSVSLSKKSHQNYRYRVTWTEGTKRKSKWFVLKKDALAFQTKTRNEQIEEGTKHEAISPAELRAVHKFREAIAKLPEHAQTATLEDAVTAFTKGLQDRHKSISCQMVTEKLLTLLKSKGRSKRHCDSTEHRLNRFNKDYGDWLACDIGGDIIDDFITGLNVASKTQENYRLALNRMFKFAVKIKAAPSNPVAEIERPTIESADTGILSPIQVASLLSSADDDTLPGLAISFFAGVRAAEIERLDWSEIDLEEQTIEIKAKNAKTAQRRIVHITDNLKEWLTPYAQHEGKVTPSPYEWRKGCKAARDSAKITEWPHNAGRHSFASYHLGMHGDSGTLATELGHANPRLLHQHYKELVTKKSAKIYWSITPTEVENIINIRSA